MSAILAAFASAGVFVGTGHFQFFTYETMTACERDRPRIESAMSAHGQTGVFTRCNATLTNSASARQ